MGDASAPVPADNPCMIAWTAYKATVEYAGTLKRAMRGASVPPHVERGGERREEIVAGSLWAAFVAGFDAAAAEARYRAERDDEDDRARHHEGASE